MAQVTGFVNHGIHDSGIPYERDFVHGAPE